MSLNQEKLINMDINENSDYVLYLSEESEKDLKDIQKYTFCEYGEEQVYKYNDVFKKSFQMILDNPDIGHSRPDIPSEYKAYQVGQHIIIFRIEGSIVYVVRVLHSSMDFIDKLG